MNPGWAWTQWLDALNPSATVSEMTDLVKTASVAEDIAIDRYRQRTEAQR